jgi:excisionase family DNA binding protein
MNFADAIRQAAMSGHAEVAATPAWVNTASTEPLPNDLTIIDLAPEDDEGGTVRLEVTLGKQQLAAVLRTVLSSPPSILTAREVAHMLRVKVTQVEELASRNEIPGFLVDGKWRFARSVVHEWMENQSKEANAS